MLQVVTEGTSIAINLDRVRSITYTPLFVHFNYTDEEYDPVRVHQGEGRAAFDAVLETIMCGRWSVDLTPFIVRPAAPVPEKA